MIHLKKSICGYAGYTCRGIEKMTVLAPPNCDTVNYDEVSDSRPQDNNFLNLPLRFESVVQSVKFIDLGSEAVWDATKCVTAYDPLQSEQGLMDAFKYIGKNASFIAANGDYNEALQCYSISNSSQEEKPGILLPSPELSTFSPVPLIAVPTASLAQAQTSPAYGGRSVRSGCMGFCTTASATGSYTVTFSIEGGKVLLEADDSGTPIQLTVNGLNNQVVEGQDNVENIQVYVLAGYDIVQQRWRAVLDWKAPDYDFSDDSPTEWVRQRQIATVKYIDRENVDVIQSQCSPIDLRDWVSQEKLPTDSSQDLFVFGYTESSAKKGWIPVKDCD